ncbi:exodeoxyribonuclease III [Candidatus Kinetoplastibacterium blastocrithidii TCC012E]|uniref:Exodeoxyribonuclease III n=1 Tax=Candidatus Kinetoplastidibacterium blastocrithidiae TCC012E TaxID=1208922 RepID=M1LB85_9PROT|nr:exodeoxyribonuclease III [Candidatus Kinetoplastibacterium blastocrithidii]AFZ83594.1 exodeoxyribonuclease III 1 [Candidatus Kinetoplastibacterium blastocrithidii (ex Strigomonas culicis)]AGF49713.1 exodeoxyribonuclease III [Candidatus Kinetoplastibacterium blastocrithidii TCC012E]
MNIATWNVNSLKVRLEQVLSFLDKNNIDVLCLQETKITDDKFPYESFNDIGYNSYWLGQKTFNGVAIVSKYKSIKTLYNFPDEDEEQKRLISITLPSKIGNICVICVYCPNGQTIGSEKYEYKIQWFKKLEKTLKNKLIKNNHLIVLGDYNIAPNDDDVYNAKLCKNQILTSEIERKLFNNLIGLGLFDAFRLFKQPKCSYSWWDYRKSSFKRNIGFRIDHVLISCSLKERCQICVIDKSLRGLERPSDHAPVIATLNTL